MKSGPIIGIFNNVAADATIEQSILSCTQMRAAHNFISDVHKKHGGLQMIQTNSGHRIPIKFVAGLPYIEMRLITKDEFNDPNIPHVTLTPEGDWNPRIVDDQVDWDELMTEIPPTSTTITDMTNKTVILIFHIQQRNLIHVNIWGVKHNQSSGNFIQ